MHEACRIKYPISSLTMVQESYARYGVFNTSSARSPRSDPVHGAPCIVSILSDHLYRMSIALVQYIFVLLFHVPMLRKEPRCTWQYGVNFMYQVGLTAGQGPGPCPGWGFSRPPIPLHSYPFPSTLLHKHCRDDANLSKPAYGAYADSVNCIIRVNHSSLVHHSTVSRHHSRSTETIILMLLCGNRRKTRVRTSVTP